jgi:hypothetical protein|tara:strand:+ start:1381 stop:1659 length:279 start_codon:yes stop_codon:yes gene_type:complete
MKNTLLNWIKNDWKNNRFRLVCETIGSLCFIAIYILLAWYGDAVSVFTIFVVQIIGSSFHIINAWLRSSVNLIALNMIVISIAVFGIIKMFI